MSLLFDDAEVAPLPPSFLAHLQPAGAFLNPETGAQSLRSPTALTQRHAPAMAPLKTHMALPLKTDDSAVAMSFMSAMRRGLDGLQGSDEDDNDDDDDDDDEEDEGGYYQPAYSQYHAPTTSFTGRASAQPSLPAADEEELIFPMEM